METSQSAPIQAVRANPFVGPRPLETGEQIYGRERETYTLLNLLVAERIVLLHSPSGAGKTSLVQAALIPQLRTRPYQLLPLIRLNLEPPPEVRQAGRPVNRYVYSLVSSLMKAIPEEQRLVAPVGGQRPPAAEAALLTLTDFLERLRAGLVQPAGAPAEPAARQKSLLFIFDQFEEILTLDPADQPARLAFFEQLGGLLNDRGCWALFSMREEYLPALDPYLVHIPTRFKTTFRLDLLNPAAALKAIQHTAADGGVEFSTPAAEKLIENLRRVRVQQLDGSLVEKPGPAVEPVQLQVVCRRLWDGLPPGTRQITEKELEAAGDVDQSLAAYYAGEVAGAAGLAGTAERQIRDWFDHQLITGQGRRGIVLKGGKESAGLDNDTIGRLEEAHLVRREERAGSTWFELAHDRLVEPVRENNAAWFEANLSPLQRQAERWEQSRRLESLLLRGRELGQAEQWVTQNRGQLNPVEREFLQQCQAARAARRRQQAITVIIAVILIALAGFSLLQANRASIEAERANDQAATATNALGLSEQRGTEAAQQAAVAVAARSTAEVQANLNLARQLALQAREASNTDLDLSLLLAAESLKRHPESLASQLAMAGLNLKPQIIQRMDGRTAVGPGLITGDKTAPFYDQQGARHNYELEMGKDITGILQKYPGTWLGYNPDGTRLAIHLKDGILIILDAATEEEIAMPAWGDLQAAASMADRVVFSRDWSRVVITDSRAYNDLSIWDAGSGKVLMRLPGLNRAVLNPDLSRAAEFVDGRITLYDTASGAEIGSILDAGIYIKFSADGKRGAALDLNNKIVVFQGDTAREVTRFQVPGVPKSVLVMDMSPDGTLVATGGTDGQVRLWDAATGALLHQGAHSSWVDTVAFSPDGRWLVSGGQDSTTRLWDTATGLEWARILQPTHLAAAVFLRDGKRIFSESFESSLRIWQLPNHPVYMEGQVNLNDWLAATVYNTDRSIQYVNGKMVTEPVWSPNLAFIPDATHVQVDITSFSGFNSSQTWDTVSGTVAPVDPASPLAFGLPWNPAGSIRDGSPFWAQVTQANRVTIYRAGSGQVMYDVTPDQKIKTISLSADGKMAAALLRDGSAWTWDPVTGHETGPGRLTGPYRQVRISPDGKRLFTIDRNLGYLRAWETATLQQVAQSPVGNNTVLFSPDLSLAFVYENYGRSGIVIAPATGKDVAGIQSASSIETADFSPDGKRLLTVSQNSPAVIQVWDAATGQPQGSLRLEGSADIRAVAFSPDSQSVISGGDRIARVWDALTGNEIGRTEHNGLVTALAFSPDGKWVASASNDGVIKVWLWRPQDLVAAICTQLPRNLTHAEWRTYLGDGPAYQPTCGSLPPAADAQQATSTPHQLDRSLLPTRTQTLIPTELPFASYPEPPTLTPLGYDLHTPSITRTSYYFIVTPFIKTPSFTPSPIYPPFITRTPP